MSTPGGSPPGTVTHLIFRATRRALPPDGEASSRRRPRSISTLSGVRVSAARFLARIRRSSGRSTVVFIQETIFPYSHIRQSAARRRSVTSGTWLVKRPGRAMSAARSWTSWKRREKRWAPRHRDPSHVFNACDPKLRDMIVITRLLSGAAVPPASSSLGSSASRATRTTTPRKTAWPPSAWRQGCISEGEPAGEGPRRPRAARALVCPLTWGGASWCPGRPSTSRRAAS